MSVDEEGKINWHLGFQGGMELELRPWKKDLIFEPEKELSKESLWLDLLIQKRRKELKIDHPIGRLMRKYNAFEYKSPDSALSINNFCKTISCAFLYAGLGETVNAIPLDELAIFMLRDSYPREMIKELERLKLTVEEQAPGIYEVKPNLGAAVYIMVTNRMNAEDCPILSLLRENADVERTGEFILKSDGLKEPGDLANIRAAVSGSADSCG